MFTYTKCIIYKMKKRELHKMDAPKQFSFVLIRDLFIIAYLEDIVF